MTLPVETDTSLFQKFDVESANVCKAAITREIKMMHKFWQIFNRIAQFDDRLQSHITTTT